MLHKTAPACAAEVILNLRGFFILFISSFIFLRSLMIRWFHACLRFAVLCMAFKSIKHGLREFSVLVPQLQLEVVEVQRLAMETFFKQRAAKLWLFEKD